MDGLHVIFEESLAQFKIKVTQDKTLAPMVIVHRFKESSGAIPSYLQGMQRRGVLISLLANNPTRNDLIAKYIVRSFNSGRVTLVVSDRKVQLQALKSILVKAYKIDPSKIGYFVRSISGRQLKQEEKDRTAEKASIILGTFGLLSRGTDIPRASVLILGTVRSDLRQTMGRVQRFLEGKKSPIIIDFADTTYKETKNSMKARMKFYMEKGLRIKEII